MRVTAYLLLLLFTLGLGACNTIEGVGEDLQAAGDTVDDEAEENKPY